MLLVFLSSASELFDTAAGIELFCGAGVKRMAIAANIQNELLDGCSGCPGIAAGAFHCRLIKICGVNSGFHLSHLTRVVLKNQILRRLSDSVKIYLA